jgi:hypothetical protein
MQIVKEINDESSILIVNKDKSVIIFERMSLDIQVSEVSGNCTLRYARAVSAFPCSNRIHVGGQTQVFRE